MRIQVLIIGKKSFVGSSIYNFIKKKIKAKLISYEDIKNIKINKYTHIINASINKKYFINKYNKSYDLDLKIAKKIMYSDVKYIFFSTRKVYKRKYNTFEYDNLVPKCNYSKNKLKTEKKLLKTLGSNVLILRVSNILGFKKDKKNKRIVHSLFLDNFFRYQSRDNKSFFLNEFKDFITINQFNRVIYLLIKNNLSGIFNVSLGKKIYLSEIILWLKKLNSKIFIKKKLNIKNSFTLSNEKLLSKIKINLFKKDVKDFCLNLHRKNYF
jgi:nucleoside-diphosphate-sugar epimerase